MAKRFFKRLLSGHGGEHRKIVTDKLPPSYVEPLYSVVRLCSIRKAGIGSIMAASHRNVDCQTNFLPKGSDPLMSAFSEFVAAGSDSA